MNAEIVQRPVAGRRLALPVEECLRIGHEVFVHLDADVIDLADSAFRKQLSNMANDGILNIVVAQYCHAARTTSRIAHL